MIEILAAIITFIFYMGLAPGQAEAYGSGGTGPSIILWIFAYLLCCGMLRAARWLLGGRW